MSVQHLPAAAQISPSYLWFYCIRAELNRKKRLTLYPLRLTFLFAFLSTQRQGDLTSKRGAFFQDVDCIVGHEKQ